MRRFSGLLLTLLTYALTAAIFFPILWMVLTGFKTEEDAVSSPPSLLFAPTWENFSRAFVNYWPACQNSLGAALFSTMLAFVLGVPAAYVLAVHPGARARSTLLWVLSTKMMPPVGVVVPFFIIFKNLHLYDNLAGLVLVFTTMNLPLAIWMLYTYLVEIPGEIFEAGRVDGASLWQEFVRIVLPVTLPGIASTALLLVIFAWNEAFFSLNLTLSRAAPLSVFISTFKTSEGLFWAQMSAAATLTILPVMIFGWIAQRQLVRGMTFGAVK